ncbi:MAG: hypothetical protein AVDCRST_MAG76-542, partial [uncultured Acidimicrobiales bacterium]
WQQPTPAFRARSPSSLCERSSGRGWRTTTRSVCQHCLPSTTASRLGRKADGP